MAGPAIVRLKPGPFATRRGPGAVTQPTFSLRVSELVRRRSQFSSKPLLERLDQTPTALALYDTVPEYPVHTASTYL